MHGLNRQSLASRMTPVYCSGNLRQLADSQEAKTSQAETDLSPSRFITFKAHPYDSIFCQLDHMPSQWHIWGPSAQTHALWRTIHFQMVTRANLFDYCILHFYRADMSAGGMNRSAIYTTSAVPALRAWRPWAT